MTTGVRPISASVLVDRELQCQAGTTLRAWAEARGMTLEDVVDALEAPPVLGERGAAVRAELAAALGVSPAALPRTGS